MATIASFIVTTLALLVFYLYIGVSGLQGGLLWSLLAAGPLSAVAGLVSWGAHRGRMAAVATFTQVPASYQFQREYAFELGFHRMWRVLGTEAEVHVRRSEGIGRGVLGPREIAA